MAYPSLTDTAARAAMIARIKKFESGGQRRWGALTPEQVMPHLADALRRALGEIPIGSAPGRVKAFILRRLFVHHLPWPKGKIKSAPGAFSTPPATWNEDRDRLLEVIERFARTPKEGLAPVHPAFGVMTAHDWGC
jgi:hypothetical protein